jgi:di/tricarboxylate transporter
MCFSATATLGVDLMLFRTEIHRIAGPHSGLLEQQQALSHLAQHDWTVAAFPVLLLIMSLTVTIMKCVLPASRLDLLAPARYAAAAESRAGRHRAS